MKRFLSTIALTVVCCGLYAAEAGKPFPVDGAKVLAPMELKDGEGGKVLTSSQSSGMAEFFFTVDAAGDYLIWGKACGKDFNSDSFFIIVDDQPPMTWDIPVPKDQKAVWQQIRGRKGEPDGKLKLTAGQHKLTVKAREANAKVEQFFIGKPGQKPDAVK